MQYSVGEQVEAERSPFSWYRGTVEAARGDSYVIRFESLSRGGRTDLKEIGAGQVRSVGALSTAPSGSPPRPRTSSPSPRLSGELSPHRPADLQQKYATLSEQTIRDRSERRKLEERMLACEHLLGEVGPRSQMRRDEAVARLERRLDELERTTHQELAVTQRRASDALAEVRRVSVASSPAYRAAASTSWLTVNTVTFCAPFCSRLPGFLEQRPPRRRRPRRRRGSSSGGWRGWSPARSLRSAASSSASCRR